MPGIWFERQDFGCGAGCPDASGRISIVGADVKNCADILIEMFEDHELRFGELCSPENSGIQFESLSTLTSSNGIDASLFRSPITKYCAMALDISCRHLASFR